MIGACRETMPSRSRLCSVDNGPAANAYRTAPGLPGTVTQEVNMDIIVYYSLEGNTELAAQKAAELLGCDTLRLEPDKAYPTGKVTKFLWGGKSAVMTETPALKPYTFDASKYDRIIFGFPVWASNIAPPIRTFIKENDLSGKRFAAIACQAGNGAEKAFDKLAALLGTSLEEKLILIDPKSRPSADNDAKIKAFSIKLAG